MVERRLWGGRAGHGSLTADGHATSGPERNLWATPPLPERGRRAVEPCGRAPARPWGARLLERFVMNYGIGSTAPTTTPLSQVPSSSTFASARADHGGRRGEKAGRRWGPATGSPRT